MNISSRSAMHLLNAFAGGTHIVVTGHINDVLLHHGDQVSLLRVLHRFGAVYDVVVTVDAVDEVAVVKGEDRWQPPNDLHDPIAAIRNLLADCSLRSLVILLQAGIVLQDPNIHDVPDRTRVAMLDLALNDAQPDSTCVLVTPSLSDIPEPIRSGSDRMTKVDIGRPTRAEREYVLQHLLVPSMHDINPEDPREVELVSRDLARLTDREPLRFLVSLARYSQIAKASARQPRALLRRHRFGEAPDYWQAVRQDLPDLRAQLESMVFGQDAAITTIVEGLAGAAVGLNMTGDPHSGESQPRMVNLFLGPTGTGKTELAKALAQVLFGERTAYHRIDMSLFGQEHSGDRLMGAPPGYVGYEAGGELTNAVRERPFIVVLLDEIDKAHPRTLDRLMSVFDDGRVTDAQGRVTYFNEAVILMTSNLGSKDLVEAASTQRVPHSAAFTYTDYSNLTPAQVEAVYRQAAHNYFIEIGRPEIEGRLKPGTVVFQPLRPDDIAPITTKIVRDTSLVHGPALDIDEPSAIAVSRRLMADPRNAFFGGRQIRNVFRSAFQRIAVWTVIQGHLDANKLHVHFELDGTALVAPDGRQPGQIRVMDLREPTPEGGG